MADRIRDGLTIKNAVLLDFVQMMGGGSALTKFFDTFSYEHFQSIKGAKVRL